MREAKLTNPPTIAHFAVGTNEGLRSTVWKAWTHKNDVYLLSRMFGSDTKVSLHASGQCSFSNTSSWIKKEEGRRNRDRHLSKWERNSPVGRRAEHVFRIIVPRDELRRISVQEDLADVMWLSIPPPGYAKLVECYLTPERSSPPEKGGMPGNHIASLKLADGKWFVMIERDEPIDYRTLSTAHEELAVLAALNQIEFKPEYRSTAFTIKPDGLHGLIELVPFDS